jgi:hypothetical protein
VIIALAAASDAPIFTVENVISAELVDHPELRRDQRIFE